MKKFEEELFSKVPCKFGLSKEGEYRQSILVEHFGKWVSPEDHQAEIEKLKTQLEKQKPEIPEVPPFVADWYEENKASLDYMIFETCRNLTDESTDEFENWFGYDENKAITTLVNMKNGYTVKEKRFYLKHIEMSKHNETRDYWFSKKDYQHVPTDKGRLPINFGYLMGYGIGYLQFTQQEIDSMAADSYEQIEVEDK